MREVENECKGTHTRAGNIDLGAVSSWEGINKVRRVRQGKGAVGRITLTKSTTQEKPWGYKDAIGLLTMILTIKCRE